MDLQRQGWPVVQLAYAAIVACLIVYLYVHSHVDQVVACWQGTTMPGRACHDRASVRGAVAGEVLSRVSLPATAAYGR